jgi:tRNA-specific 2-thiouridylase
VSKLIYGVAMSGGVDSSVTAALLQKEGFNIFGVTMKIHDNCDQAIEDAQIICKKLGIEHFVLDIKKQFKEKIIETFVNYYAQGLTPNPCAFCNRDIKMNLLLNFVKENGADLMATGHYANIQVAGDSVILTEAVCQKRDQSYFLSLVSKNNLKYVRFPLGQMASKNETRAIAESFNMHNFKKKDSQDICFIPSNDYKTFLKNYSTNINLFAPGNVILKNNQQIIGKHLGIANYTVGQRKGLGISHSNPLYVVEVNPQKNEIIVDVKEALNKINLNVNNVNWIIDMPSKFTALIKLRSVCDKIQAQVEKFSNDAISITLMELTKVPVTPGQVCCLYNELTHAVIGAGIISYHQHDVNRSA